MPSPTPQCCSYWKGRHLGFLDYCLHLYCYFHNVSADMFFRLLQVFVELGNLHETSKEITIWRLQIQSWLLASNNTGILNACTRLWLMETEQATPVDSIKDVVRSSVKFPKFDKHLKKGWRTYRAKHCNNYKDEDNSLKTLNDKSHR